MKRPITIGIIFLLFLGMFIGMAIEPATAAVGDSPPRGTLYIKSYPAGATILINGTDYGTTNKYVTSIPSGNQNLILTKEGYQPYTTVVNVPVDGVSVLAPFTLTKGGDGGVPPPSTGTLYIKSYPAGATILIDGTDYGTTNKYVTSVTSGDQNLILIKEGYQPYTTVVKVPVDGVSVLAPFTLTKGGDGGVPPPATGTLYIKSYPAGATILIDGTDYGTTNKFVTSVPSGDQNLILIKEGYQPYTTIVKVPVDGISVLAPFTLTKGGVGDVENIQAAVDAASEGDILVLQAGTYSENIVIQKSLTIIGAGPDLTIINGNTGIHQNEGGVINISKPFPHAAYTPNVTLVGMTITGGTANYGGGIFNGGGNLSLSGISVTNCTAPSAGGIYNQYGTVIMDESSVSGNTAKSGGGVENDEGTFIMSAGSSISGNMAGLGGGIANLQGTIIMNDGSSISNNSATYYGGGIYSYYYSTITLNGGSITGNTAENGTGGGIYIDSSSTVNQVGGTVSGNHPDDISYEFEVTYLGATAGTISIDTQNWFYIVNLSGLAPDTEYWLAGEGLPDIFDSGTTDANGDLRLQGVLNPAPNLRREYSPFYAGTGQMPPTAGLVALDGKECSGGITSTGLFGTLKEDGAPLSGKKVEFYTYDPYTLEINYPSFGSDTTDSDGEFCKVFFGGHLGENVACEYDGTWDMNMEKAAKCPIC